MPTKTNKPKPKPKPAPAEPTVKRLRRVCPTIMGYDGRVAGVGPWVWLGGGGTLPAVVQAQYDKFGQPQQQLIDGATGRRRRTWTLVVRVKGLGQAVIAGASTGDKPARLTLATAVPDAQFVADAAAGTYGEPLTDGFFAPETTAPRLVRFCELAVLAVAALFCRTEEPGTPELDALAELYADSWRWEDEYPVGPLGTKIDMADPRTWA